MELIVLLLVSLPIGYFVRSRTVGFLVLVAVHSFVYTFQSTVLLTEWAGGDTSAFGPFPHASGGDTFGYGIVNLVFYGVGLGLVALGQWLRARRDAKRTAPVDLAG